MRSTIHAAPVTDCRDKGYEPFDHQFRKRVDGNRCSSSRPWSLRTPGGRGARCSESATLATRRLISDGRERNSRAAEFVKLTVSSVLRVLTRSHFGFQFLPGHLFLVAASPGDHHVVNVFPQLPHCERSMRTAFLLPCSSTTNGRPFKMPSLPPVAPLSPYANVAETAPTDEKCVSQHSPCVMGSGLVNDPVMTRWPASRALPKSANWLASQARDWS